MMDLGPIHFDPNMMVVLAGAALVAAVLVAVVVALFRRRAERPVPAAPDLSLNVADLQREPPPEEGPRLEVYGVPVRLAALVLAPAGRNNPLPATEALAAVLEDLLPGLMSVIRAHRPRVCRWPFQLSTQGFAHAFFNNVALPGDRGKGTPWCSVAGRFDSGDKQFLAGLVCVATKPNSLGQITVPHVGQWLDAVRIRA